MNDPARPLIQSDSSLEQELLGALDECRAPLLNYAARLCGSIDGANDALQEASLRFLVARRGGATFDNPHGWLFRVVRHHLIDQIRKHSRETTLGHDQLARIADPGACPDQAYRQTFLADTIDRALSKRERMCILHRLDGMSYGDIGQFMGISTNTVGALIHRAVEKVRSA